MRLEKMNPGVDPKKLHAGDVLKYRKATRGREITGWRSFTTSNIADRYNGGGDPNYAAKLDYVLDLFTKLKR